MTPLHERELPDGYQLDWNEKTYNTGFVFRWSEVYSGYLADGYITVRPGDTLQVAYERERGAYYNTDDTEIFFLKD